MLMRIREQKGWIRGIFVVLILVFASSFVIGGVGSGSNFSLSDIIGNDSGSSSSHPELERRLLAAQADQGAAEERRAVRPARGGVPGRQPPR